MSIRKKIKKRLPIFGRRMRQESSDGSSPEKQPTTPMPSVQTSAVETTPTSKRGDLSVKAFLDTYIKEHQILIFMKGSPSDPKCGFSATASSILTSYQVPYEHFDVFLDQDVRDGVKQFSSWPTLPQIYIGGEFMGGCDIITQMHNNGELKEEIVKLNT
jgi:monothiol glutaredoxin